MFEKAKWIAGIDIKTWGHPSCLNPPPAPYIIRDFTVKKGLKKATLNASGLGQAVYHINGDKIPDSVHPTHITQYVKSVCYNVFDIKDLLAEGKNRFGAIIGHIYLADLEYMYRMGCPRIIFQIDLEYESGETETIVSDTNSLVHDSPYLFSLRRCGERYDAKKVIEGWSRAETSTEGWGNAAICAGPGGAFRKKICPPKRVFEEIEGIEIAPGVFDFGENLSGWVRFTVEGKKEDVVSVFYSEWLTDDKMHASDIGLQKGTYPEMLHRDEYFPKGDGVETFEPVFTFHGFRYAEIKGAEKVSAVAIKVHTDLKHIAKFECDNYILNEIHKYTDRSILACAQGAMLDCPQREQNEWTGDGLLTSDVVSMEYDSYDMFYEWMLNFKDDQKPSGHLPGIIPCRSLWPYSFANGLDWSSAIIHIPYYAYKYSGNSEIVSLMWENMERAMGYFASRSENCLMDFGVGDWVSTADEKCPVEITDTIYYRIDALMMAEMAKEIGEDASRWLSLAEDIKKEFRAKYVKNGELTNRHFTTLICSVYSGMLDGDEIKNHTDKAAELVKAAGYAFKCGVHGLRMVFDVFGKGGYNDLVYKVLTNTEVMGYGKCVKDKLTSLPEQFDYATEENPDGTHTSRNHHFLGMVDGWFYRFVAGINVDGFGWDNLVIEPCKVEGIKAFDAEVRGIKVSLKNGVYYIKSPYDFKLNLGAFSGFYKAGTYSF